MAGLVLGPQLRSRSFYPPLAGAPAPPFRTTGAQDPCRRNLQSLPPLFAPCRRPRRPLRRLWLAPGARSVKARC